MVAQRTRRKVTQRLGARHPETEHGTWSRGNLSESDPSGLSSRPQSLARHVLRRDTPQRLYSQLLASLSHLKSTA